MPIFLAWLTNAGNVASVGTAGYEGYKAYQKKSLEGMAAVVIGAGVIVILSLIETSRQSSQVIALSQNPGMPSGNGQASA